VIQRKHAKPDLGIHELELSPCSVPELTDVCEYVSLTTTMSTKVVERFSVSINRDLLRQFDRMVKEKGYQNRSLAVADMVRSQIVEHEQQMTDGEAVGTVTLVYDHHTAHVQESLTEIQHDHGHSIVSALHVHLDHHNCLEVLVVRGRGSAVKSLADRLIAAKGVKHGKLTLTTTGEGLPV